MVCRQALSAFSVASPATPRSTASVLVDGREKRLKAGRLLRGRVGARDWLIKVLLRSARARAAPKALAESAQVTDSGLLGDVTRILLSEDALESAFRRVQLQ